MVNFDVNLILHEVEELKSDTNFIELIRLLKHLYQGKRLIFISACCSAVLGVIFALLIPNTFTSGAKFLPQTGNSEISAPGGLGGLASLAGINLSAMASSSDIPTNLYPQIVKSIPFRNELLAEELRVDGKQQTLKDYLNFQLNNPTFFGVIRKYSIGLPELIIGAIRGKGLEDESNDSEIFRITEEDKKLFKLLSEQLVIKIFEVEGIVSIEFSDYDKEVAAKVADAATKLLQDRIIEYKNQSAKELLRFSKRQYEDHKREFNILQDSISNFKDSNKYIRTSIYQNQLDRLNHELNISAAVLEQLANQVEQAKLQVNQDTPIFMVIEPVSTPYEKSSPNRPFIVFAWIFMGMLVPFCYLILREPYEEVARRIREI